MFAVLSLTLHSELPNFLAGAGKVWAAQINDFLKQVAGDRPTATWPDLARLGEALGQASGQRYPTTMV